MSVSYQLSGGTYPAVSNYQTMTFAITRFLVPACEFALCLVVNKLFERGYSGERTCSA